MSVVFARVHFFIEAPIRQPNKMVDALSQCVTLLSTIRTHMPGFDTLCELYLADALFNQIYAELLEGGKQEKYVLLNCYFFVVHSFVFQLVLYENISFMNYIMNGILDRIRCWL